MNERNMLFFFWFIDWFFIWEVECICRKSNFVHSFAFCL